MIKGKRIIVVASMIFASILLSFLRLNTVSAVDKTEIMKKWVFIQYNDCLSTGKNAKTISSGAAGMISNNVFDRNSAKSYALPSLGFPNSLATSQASTNCYGLLVGEPASITGVMKFANLKDTQVSGDGAAELLDKLGYDSKSENAKEFSIDIYENGNKVNSTTVRQKDGSFNVDGNSYGWKANNVAVRIDNFGTKDAKLTVEMVVANASNCQTSAKTVSINLDGLSINDLRTRLNSALPLSGAGWSDRAWNMTCKQDSSYYRENTNPTVETKYNFGVGEVVDAVDGYTYRAGSNESVIKNLSGIENIPKGLMLTPSERYTLYAHYVKSGGEYDCTSDASPWDDALTVRMKVNGGFKNCYLKYTSNSTLYTVSTTSSRIVKTTIEQVVKWMNEVNVDTLTDIDSVVTSSPDDDDGLVDCAGADLNGQGWFLCPTLTNMTYTATFFDKVIEDWLSVDTDYYSSSSPTYGVWEVMRNIANVLMAIFLLVIIFSQLTGFGINNYGIKKMLPRFIVMAILINLSYIVCEIAVDLSNILGISLRNIFGAMGEGLSVGGEIGFIPFIVSGLLGAVGIAGGVAGTAVTIGGLAGAGVVAAPIIVLVLILAIIPIIFAVLLFFVMLGGRFIIIIGCIAISPVVFVLYILPNTQSLFKKWWSLFKAVLIMFPICGVIGGVSVLIRGMVISLVNGGSEMPIWMAVVGLIAPFLPFFMLPSLLKSAISMLGTAGAALLNLGEKVKAGASKGVDAVQRSGAYQEATKLAQERAATNRANRTIQRLSGRNNLNKLQQKQLNDAQKVVNAAKINDARMAGGEYMITDEEAKARAASMRDAEEFKSYASRYEGLTTMKEMGDELDAAVKAYEDSDDNNRHSAAIRLESAIMAAESKGWMNKFLKNPNSKLAMMKLDNTKSEDAGLLGRMSASSNIAMSQFGKQMGNAMTRGENVKQSLADFAEGTNAGGVTLSNALKEIGNNALSGRSDDELEFINDKGTSISATMAAVAAANAKNDKELKQANKLLNNADWSSSFTFNGSNFAKVSDETAEILKTKAQNNDAVKNELIRSAENVLTSPELVNQMSSKTSEVVHEFAAMGHNIQSSGINDPVQAQNTARSATGTLHVQHNDSDLFISAKQNIQINPRGGNTGAQGQQPPANPPRR